MANERSTFISEIFWTTDERFSFQVVGCYYNLYDREHGYYFTEKFRSFQKMQDFMNEVRNRNAKEVEA